MAYDEAKNRNLVCKQRVRKDGAVYKRLQACAKLLKLSARNPRKVSAALTHCRYAMKQVKQLEGGVDYSPRMEALASCVRRGYSHGLLQRKRRKR